MGPPNKPLFGRRKNHNVFGKILTNCFVMFKYVFSCFSAENGEDA